MATDKQIVSYVKKRIKIYNSSQDHYMDLAKSQPGHSVLFSQRAKQADAAALALEHILFYAENGTQDPSLITQVLAQTKADEEVVE